MLNFSDFVKANPQKFQQFSCKDLLFLICECPEVSKIEDWSEHNCFVHVLGGQVIFHSRERSWNLRKGETVFVRKGACGIERTQDESYCCLLFYVPDSYIRSFVRDNSAQFIRPEDPAQKLPHLMCVETTSVLMAFYESVLSYFLNSVQPPEDLVELKFRELLLNTITNEKNGDLTSFFCKLGLCFNDDLQELMELNCLYNLQLHEYARLCHRSLAKFKRDFYASFGMSPGRWLLEKRLAKASELLKQSEIPVTDVVIESGFKNLAHFDRVFKKYFNMAPLKYRKQVHKELAYS